MIRDKGADGFLRPDLYSKDEERIISEARKGKMISDDKYEAAVHEESAKELPMKWHNFMMVIMVIGAIGNFAYGILMIIRGIECADRYYYIYGLSTILIEYGILLMAFGVFWFFVRNRLKKYKKDGPVLLISSYIAGLTMSIFFSFAVAGMTRAELDIRSIVMRAVATGVIIILHKVYYGKRKRLFDK